MRAFGVTAALCLLVASCASHLPARAPDVDGPDAVATDPDGRAPSQARLELRGPTRAVIGRVVTLELVNVDDRDLAFLSPGGTNDCAAFRWRLDVRTAAGTSLTTEPFPMYCTAVMVDPEWVVLPRGATVTLSFGTGARFRDALDPRPDAPEAPLAPGRYTLSVHGVSTTLDLVAP